MKEEKKKKKRLNCIFVTERRDSIHEILFSVRFQQQFDLES